MFKFKESLMDRNRDLNIMNEHFDSSFEIHNQKDLTKVNFFLRNLVIFVSL